MFLYFTFPTRTSRWSDRHGSNPSISPMSRKSCLRSNSVCRAPSRNTRTVPPTRRCQKSAICPRNYIQISTNHATCSTTTRVYTCFLASGCLVFRSSEHSIAAFENERGRGKAEAFIHHLDFLLRVQVTLEFSRLGRGRDNTNSPAMTRI